LSTLRYANRAKNIKNKPKINEDPKDAMLREYQDEIKVRMTSYPADFRCVCIALSRILSLTTNHAIMLL